ncbi:MAG: hypothetical protein ACERLB_13415 [Gammaproteobacteria bacterium]
MSDMKVRAIINDAPDLVTTDSARLEDILALADMSTGKLEKFYDYWQAEAEAARQLVEAFTHLNFGYLQTDAIPHEVRQRLKLAREQERLYKQEHALQTALDDSKPAR